MTEASNPLTIEQHRLFAGELEGIKTHLEEFRVALAGRYGEDFEAGKSLRSAIEAITETQRLMAQQVEHDLPDVEEDVYGQTRSSDE